jgi:hypothetical protein
MTTTSLAPVPVPLPGPLPDLISSADQFVGSTETDASRIAAAAICAYLAERAQQGASAGTRDGACSAISYQHRSRGLDDPIACDALRHVRRGLRRTIGTAPQRLARPTGGSSHPSDLQLLLWQTPAPRTYPVVMRSAKTSTATP